MNESSPQPLRVFVSEYVTGGAWSEGVPTGSLAREGAAMLQGVVADLAEVPGLELHTTWDRRLRPAEWCRHATGPICSPLTVHEANSPEQEAELFAFWSGAANAALVIAPRELPWNLVHLRNLTALAEAGARIAPPVPAWYHRPTSLEEMVDFLVIRIFDNLGLSLGDLRRWEGPLPAGANPLPAPAPEPGPDPAP